MTKDNHPILLVPVNSNFSQQIAIKLSLTGKPVILLSEDEDLLELLTFEIENLGGRAYPIYCSWNSNRSVANAVSILQSNHFFPDCLVIFFAPKSNATNLDSALIFENPLVSKLIQVSVDNLFVIDQNNEAEISIRHILRSGDFSSIKQIKKANYDFGFQPFDQVVGFILSSSKNDNKSKPFYGFYKQIKKFVRIFGF